MVLKNSARRTITIFIFLALLFSLLDISKAFFVPHCLAFDVNDDANHTFINLQQWRRILGQNEWPVMNVYNNFGAPLIGDVITYPLSPLSLTYAFLPGPVAMSVNRTLIGFFTLFLLFIFYYRRFPLLMSIGLGLCTYYAPGFLWHSAHHHFQLSLLVLTAFLLLQEKFTKNMSVINYVAIAVLSIIMFMSVSLNVAVIWCLLILGYQFFLSGGIRENSFWLVFMGLVCGMIAVFPDTWLFLQAASRSMRGLAEYPVGSYYGPNKIFWTPVVAAGIYSIVLFREKRYIQGGIVFWLGVIPFSIVLLSRTLPFLWKEIPLLGATDVVRLTWGASIFMMIGAGGLLLRWLEGSLGWRWQVLFCLLALGLDAYYLPFRQEWYVDGRLILAVVLVLVTVGFAGWIVAGSVVKDKIKAITVARGMAGFIGGAVVVFYLYYGFFDVLGFSFPNVCHVTGRGAFSLDGSEKFPLPKALDVIHKNSRVAYDFNTIYGMDLRGAGEGLFGAGARSTIMTNADFSVGLFNKGLVKFDNYTGDYHFSGPWQAKELQDLGIFYVVQGKDDKLLEGQGWKLVSQEEGAFVYQNPLPTGVVFLKNPEGVSPVPFDVRGNGLDVQLPLDRKVPQELVISLLSIPGWRAWVDGRPCSFLEGKNNFLVLSVLPKDHFVRVRYSPVPAALIFACFFIALAIPWVVVMTGFWKETQVSGKNL